ncbi:MAG: hypothetical protein JSV88_24070, partial [Candidatus Aminicenantes bacterium]
EKPQLRLYKSYFNVAWFVRAYSQVLSKYSKVITTNETLDAVYEADKDKEEKYRKHWKVPDMDVELSSIGRGFDAQVELAAEVAQKRVERLLLFQDPLDVLEHLPEMHALIRNCTLAGVGLHINAGATFWAEAQWKKMSLPSSGFGRWRNYEKTADLHKLLNPPKQTIAFISHDAEKPNMSRFIYHYREQFRSADLRLIGTSGTCQHARQYLEERVPPYEDVPDLRPAAETSGAGHGPTGGDVVIADEIIKRWPVDIKQMEKDNKDKPAYEYKPPVREKGVSHVVVFFIDHTHAQPHQADIHVLLRTCLHPSHGVHLILNERTAIDWGETLRCGLLDGNANKR